MSDATQNPTPRAKTSLLVQDRRTRRRNAAEARFKAYGLTAILIGLFFVLYLVFSIVKNGLPAFTSTNVSFEFTLTQEQYDHAEAQLMKTSAYQNYFNEALNASLAERGLDVPFDKNNIERIMGKVGGTLREFYRANEDQLGQPVQLDMRVASRVEGYLRGRLSRENVDDNNRFIKPADLDLIDALVEIDMIQSSFNRNFLTGADTGVDNPGGAGFGASVVGSFFMMLVVLLLSLPIGVSAAIYLEEFAPKNRLTDFIEVNISNLAAVPSIVFGILGLAVFIQFGGGVMGVEGLKASAPLVGGLVLTLMTLPRIIIPARAALKAVPPSIRDAALGVGASKMQSVFHHVLPLAAPGILTGLIIGLAQALGETAPLLLIGMVGLVARGYPESFMDGFTEPNSAMPAQIYTWVTRADPAFYDSAWGGIIILLIFLLTMNIIAVILRRKFERRW